MNLKKHSTFFVVALAIFVAIALRQAGFYVDGLLDSACIILRAAIYIVLFAAAWSISIRSRIIQLQVRRYLVTTSQLMMFWVVVRGIRYILDDSYWLKRHLWYLFYLPMLFIPLLNLLVALSLRKPENYSLSKRAKLLLVPTLVLFLLVLTNDLHQLVFVFPADAKVWLDDYRYGIIYFGVIGWMLFCVLAALVIMVKKCRIPYSRRMLVQPFVPATMALVYGILYVLRETGVFELAWLKLIAGDMTIVFCLFYIAVLESCIRCDLIQTNTGYEELFMVSILGAQITNRENVVCLASSNALEFTEEQLKEAQIHPVSLDNNTMLISHPIRFGHVLWQEDVTELSRVIQQIEENCHELAEHNRIQQENLKTQKQILTLQEKNHATDLLHRETAVQMNRIEQLLAQYDTVTDDRKRAGLLAGVAVVGAYIKRYGNLLLVSQQEENADINDLLRCFEDSFVNVELLDVKCLCTLPVNITLATKDMLYIYRTFERIVETCLYDLRCIWVNARESKECLIFNMEFDCDTDLSPFTSAVDLFSCEDGVFHFTFKLKKGGEEK